MALRYKFDGEIPRPKPNHELVRPLASREPKVCEFRRGAKMDELVRGMLDTPLVNLDAAVGSGKSTAFPSALARVTKCLVMHVVPNKLLAVDLHSYVTKLADSSGVVAPPYELWSNASQAVPRTGVLFMSSNDLVQLVASRGSLEQYKGVSVFLDESHESDACTFLIRELGLNLGMQRLVFASATFGPSGYRMRETPGDVKMSSYDLDEDVRSWDIDDAKKPWGYAHIRKNNLLVFTDSRADAKLLNAAYSDVGMVVHTLRAGMDTLEFLSAMRALRDQKGPLVVLLADSSFRSGFTFEVDRVIDTGAVSYMDPTPGAIQKLSRPMYGFERYQASSRGSCRMRKSANEYFCPDYKYPERICDVEGVEREAAAYLCRCMGFRPSGTLAGLVMSEADLPASLSVLQAMNAVYPITYQVIGSDGKPRPRVDSASEVSSATESVIPQRRDERSSSDDVHGCVDAFVALSRDDLLPNVGCYLKVDGVRVHEPSSMMFPAGLRSVRAFVGGNEDGVHNVRGLLNADCKAAISLVANRYNLLNVEVEAIDSVLSAAVPRAHMSSPRQRQDAMSLFDTRARFVAERRELHMCLGALTQRRYRVSEIAPLRDVVSDRAAAYGSCLSPDEHGIADDDYASELQGLMLGPTDALKRLSYGSELPVYDRLDPSIKALPSVVSPNSSVSRVNSGSLAHLVRPQYGPVKFSFKNGLHREVFVPLADDESGDSVVKRRVPSTARKRVARRSDGSRVSSGSSTVSVRSGTGDVWCIED